MTDAWLEEPTIFELDGRSLVGIVHGVTTGSPVGVLVVVGGPQYRVGSHRQFVQLARHLAAHGIPTLRFDVTGMGDSEGELRDFEQIDDDIAAAIDVLTASTGIEQVVLWGLCDAATAACFYASGGDPRVCGLVLVNPWVHEPEGRAKTYLRHHYRSRVFDKDFYRRALTGNVDFVTAIRDLLRNLRTASRRWSSQAEARRSLPDRMLTSLAQLDQQILLVLSGRDITAREFEDALRSRASAAAPRLRQLLTAAHAMPHADHTFSDPAASAKLEQLTLAFVRAQQSS